VYRRQIIRSPGLIDAKGISQQVHADAITQSRGSVSSKGVEMQYKVSTLYIILSCHTHDYFPLATVAS
jgi:hypothetical protein